MKQEKEQRKIEEIKNRRDIAFTKYVKNRFNFLLKHFYFNLYMFYENQYRRKKERR